MKHWISCYFGIAQVVTPEVYGLHPLELRTPTRDLLAREIPCSFL